MTAQDGARLSALVQELAADVVDALQAAVAKARGGNRAAVRSYVRGWRALEDRLLPAFGGAVPDMVVKTDRGVFLVDAEGRPSPHLTDVFHQEALHAPFSVWVQALGDGPGVAVHLIAAARRLTGRAPVTLPEQLVDPLLFAEESRSLEPARFLRLAWRELDAERSPLDRVADLFELTDTDLGRLFAVSRQRVSQWREEGVPVAHQPKLNAMARMADVLEGNLVPERIPGIVRAPAPAFGERSLLGQIAENGQDEALRQVEDSFDWAKTA